MIDGCLEKGRDIYNGGSEITLIGLMMITFANTVDSMYAIQELCFGDDSQVSLEYLLLALKSDWGFNLQEPWQDPTDGEIPKEMKGLSMKMLRDKALKLPKLGLKAREEKRDAKRLSNTKYESLKDIAQWLAQEVVTVFTEVTTNEKYTLVNTVLPNIRKNFNKEIHFALGSGTFEGYVGWGYGIAASADGRRKGW